MKSSVNRFCLPGLRSAMEVKHLDSSGGERERESGSSRGWRSPRVYIDEPEREAPVIEHEEERAGEQAGL